MIKVGQIYKEEDGKRFVTTRKIEDTDMFEIIYEDGRTNNHSIAWIADCEFIAEYPTWKEAVNSKEFNDRHKTDRELEKKLEIAVKALITYKNLRYDGTVSGYEYIAKEALAKIKEIK